MGLSPLRLVDTRCVFRNPQPCHYAYDKLSMHSTAPSSCVQIIGTVNVPDRCGPIGGQYAYRSNHPYILRWIFILLLGCTGMVRLHLPTQLLGRTIHNAGISSFQLTHTAAPQAVIFRSTLGVVSSMGWWR